jgi:DNA-directed RNA polymerase subunit M/transcription elongation factor TFIIS
MTPEQRQKIINYLETKTSKDLATIFENAVYEETSKRSFEVEQKLKKLFILRYNYNLTYVVQNIKAFEEKIRKKQITPQEIMKDPVVMFADKWKTLKLKKEREDTVLYENKLISNCDTKCPKCNQENVNRISKQLRSADEPETEIYTCLYEGCKYSWRQY